MKIKKIKRALIFCVVCLILWAAWGSRANAEEDTEDDNNFYYAWSDIDSNGQPELVILRQADEEDSYVSLLKLERVGGLDICTFAVRASEKEQYHVATDSSTLSYYEMGVLVKEHDVTDMSADEMEALYPDLNFWIKG